jgi:CHASE2 domain-containing sensor protein
VPPPAPVPRERLLGLLLLGVALVLLVSSPTWFASGQGLVGAAQVFLALVLAGVGVWLYRRAQRTG